MKDGGNDEKRQDNSKVENMERVSADGWLTAQRIWVQASPLLFKTGTSFLRIPASWKKYGLDMSRWGDNTTSG